MATAWWRNRMSFLELFEATNANHVSGCVSIWNAACGASLTINSPFVEYNTHPATGAVQAGRVALRYNEPVGFVLASALPNDPQTSSPEVGWIDAIAVVPQFQRQGIGSDLLAWAEQWLREQGCTRARLGGSLRPFVPGYPTELGNAQFFRARGFAERTGSARVWDVARDLHNYARNPKDPARPFGFECHTAQSGDESALVEFLAREFPGRWRFEFQEFWRASGRMADWIILTTQRGVDGFAKLCFEDSITPINRVYPWNLPRPWGQLGPIGVSQDVRGKGFGGALLDAALCHLRERGVRGCVIDWTDLVDFYAKFGFARYREYLMMIKSIEQ